MFVGFIAVVVILLVVVGLMSTGATNGSGGVDQTKATKVISEISALVQSTGFYKTTNATSSYSGVTVANLVAAGIVDSADTVTTTAAGTAGAFTTITTDDGTTQALIPTTTQVIVSKSVPGVYYVIGAGASTNQFKIQVAADATTLSSTLKSALQTNYSKLAGSAAVAPASKATPISGGMTAEFK